MIWKWKQFNFAPLKRDFFIYGLYVYNTIEQQENALEKLRGNWFESHFAWAQNRSALWWIIRTSWWRKELPRLQLKRNFALTETLMLHHRAGSFCVQVNRVWYSQNISKNESNTKNNNRQMHSIIYKNLISKKFRYCKLKVFVLYLVCACLWSMRFHLFGFHLGCVVGLSGCVLENWFGHEH